MNKTISFAITALLFLIVILFSGIWAESYQHMYDTAISGEFTKQLLGTAYNPFPEYMPGAAKVFHFLTSLIEIRWIFYFLYGTLFLSIWAIYYNLLKFSKDFSLISKVLLIVFFAVLFFESISLYHMVRIAMFAGIAGLSILLIRNDNKFITLSTIPFFLLFILALWIRGNVVLFMMIFITIAFLLHSRSIKPLIIYWGVLTISLLHYFTIVFWTDYSNDLNFFFLYNTEFKLHHTGQYTPDLKLVDELDSVKYEAIKNDILADELYLPSSFYNKIGVFTNLSKTNLSQLTYAYNNATRLLKENAPLVLADVFLVIFYMLWGGATLKNFRIKTMSLFIIFYLIILGVSFIKMENRFMVPYQTFFLLLIVAFHKPAIFTEKKHVPILFLFVAVFSYMSLSNSFKKIDMEKKETENFKYSFDVLAKNNKDATIVLNTGFITKNKPYEVFYQINYFNKFYIHNYFAIQLHPFYRPFLEQECNCNVGSLLSFYKYLNGAKSNVLLLDYDNRIMVLKQFTNTVYKTNIDVEKVELGEDFNLMGFNGSLSVFKLKEVL